jgi:hypothetical protein
MPFRVGGKDEGIKTTISPLTPTLSLGERVTEGRVRGLSHSQGFTRLRRVRGPGLRYFGPAGLKRNLPKCVARACAIQVRGSFRAKAADLKTGGLRYPLREGPIVS